MLNGISCLWKRLLICKLFSYNYTRIKLFMYFCLLHLYVCIMYLDASMKMLLLYFLHTCIRTFLLIKKPPNWSGRYNAFIRLQLLAIIFQVSVFLLWELHSFHDTNRTSSKDQNPTCKHTGQGMGGGWKRLIYLYIWTCLYKNFTKLL